MTQEPKPWQVYVLKDPRTLEVRYVGVTSTDLPRRLKRHLAAVSHERPTHRTKWIASLLREGVTPIIESIDSGVADWESTERQWIATYRARGANLTNSTDGGFGSLGRPVTDEYRQRVRERMSGKPRPGNPDRWRMTPAARAKISASLRGRIAGAEERERKSRAATGRVLSEEAKAKLRAFIKTPEHRRKLSIANSGERSRTAKLTEETVIEIRKRRAEGVTFQALADTYSVRHQTIQSLCAGRSWGHIPIAPAGR